MHAFLSWLGLCVAIYMLMATLTWTFWIREEFYRALEDYPMLSPGSQFLAKMSLSLKWPMFWFGPFFSRR